jgi:hypothetical protein
VSPKCAHITGVNNTLKELQYFEVKKAIEVERSERHLVLAHSPIWQYQVVKQNGGTGNNF